MTRAMTEDAPMTARQYAELWRSWARANLHRAELREQQFDSFGARLCRVRAVVRMEAADLVLRCATLTEAANTMHHKASELWVRTFPIIGFDKAAIEYTQARTWQSMARALNPELPVVQEKFD